MMTKKYIKNISSESLLATYVYWITNYQEIYKKLDDKGKQEFKDKYEYAKREILERMISGCGK